MPYLLLIGLVVSSGIAWVWPATGIAYDPFEVSPSGLWWLVASTMFCLGTLLQPDELRELRLRPLSVWLGLAVQVTLMPCLAWLAVTGLRMQGELALGVILVGCVPGAMASNVLTMTARGNVSYSVSLTTLATLLSPLTVPTALWLIGSVTAGGAALQPGKTATTLATSVVLPVLLGFACRQLSSRVRQLAAVVASPVASLALLWIIASVVAGNRERLGQIQLTLLVALALINLLGYLGGYGIGRWAALPASMRRALALEVGMQNAGLGTALAATLFGADSLAQIPTAAYTFGCMLSGAGLAAMWASYPLPTSGGDAPSGP